MKLQMILSDEHDGKVAEVSRALTDTEMYQYRNGVSEILVQTFRAMEAALTQNERDKLKKEDDEMRKCKAAQFDGMRNVEFAGIFHQFAPAYRDLEYGVGNYVVALVEDETGQVHKCPCDSVRFLDSSKHW